MAWRKIVWRPESISQIFVAFAEADSIGLSSIAGLLRSVSRTEACGLRVDLAPLETARAILHAPSRQACWRPGPYQNFVRRTSGGATGEGTIALDGERELAFTAGDHVTVRLDRHGPLTIKVDKAMAAAVRDWLFLAGGEVRLEEEGVVHEIGQIGATASISDYEGHPRV